MFEALQYDFIKHAIIAGVLVSIVSGVIGSLVVANRMVFLAGGIAHSAYGGIGVAIFFGLPIFFGAGIFAIISALIMAHVTLQNRHQIDTVVGLVWSIGMAIGIILVDLSPGYNVDLMSYLFGSILAVSFDDLIVMSVSTIIILITVALFYRNFLSISYDSEFASLQGVNVRFFYTLMLILSAIAVVTAIRVVGLILVIALLSIPTYIAEKIASSLAQMMIYSTIISTLFTLLGLILSYHYDLTSGSVIILVSAVALLLFLLYKSIFAKGK
ncbi:MAG: metal ABC transporter permease [Campylobacterales bacterium]|nr:metal ABC transporter permease [Campylobacterales bacterium]